MKRLLPIIALLGLTACFNGTGKEIKPANHTVSNTETKSPEPAVTSPQKTAEQEKYTAQVEQYTAAIEADPKVPENYTHRAYAYHKLENFEAAGVDANKALSLNPKNPETLQIALFLVGNYELNQRNNLELAKSYFKKASEVKPSAEGLLTLSYYSLGKVFEKQNNYDRALNYYIMATKQDTKDNEILSDIYLSRGYLYAKNQKPWQAIDDYQKVVELRQNSPKLWEPHYQLGIVLDSVKNYYQAIDEYTQAFNLNSDNFHFQGLR